MKNFRNRWVNWNTSLHLSCRYNSFAWGYRWISSKDTLIFEIPSPSSSKCFWRMCGILSLSVKRDSSSSSLRFSFSRAENLSSNVAWAFSFAWQYFQRSDYHCNWNTKQFQFFLQQPAFICISMYFVVRQPLIPPRLPTLIMHLESYKKCWLIMICWNQSFSIFLTIYSKASPSLTFKIWRKPLIISAYKKIWIREIPLPSKADRRLGRAHYLPH